LSKKLALIYVIAIVLIYNAYNYVNNRVINPFMIDASKYITENGADNLLHTKQDYNFRLVNTSDKAVKLINIELQGYQGIKPDILTVSGKPLTAQGVKSDRVYSSPSSWSTNSQGLTVEYQVEILEPKIQNPKSALITYSYFGIKHKQDVNFPSAHSASFSNNMIVTSKIINFNVSIFSTFIMVLLLVFIYTNRELDEGYLGWKIFGYYYLGAFNLNLNLLFPLGIIIYLLLFRPNTNAKIKMYSAIIGFTFMIFSYVFPYI
jgi:hypothetical protein